MMEAKKPIGKVVPFEAVHEPWCEFQLADGNLLRVRLNLIAVYNTGKINPDGKATRSNYLIFLIQRYRKCAVHACFSAREGCLAF